LKGEPIKENDTDVTLGMVMSAALLSAGKGEDPERAYKLAKASLSGEDVTFKVEDITFIKEYIKKSSLPTLLTGQALTLLDV